MNGDLAGLKRRLAELQEIIGTHQNRDRELDKEIALAQAAAAEARFEGRKVDLWSIEKLRVHKAQNQEDLTATRGAITLAERKIRDLETLAFRVEARRIMVAQGRGP